MWFSSCTSSSKITAAREKVQCEAEGIGGCRLGEVTGGGDGHGLLADRTAILECDGEVVVEMHLEHSKTGFARYLDYAGTTKGSGVECAAHLREYWRLAGFHTETVKREGVTITRPDFSVVRVDLSAVSETQFERLSQALKGSKDKQVRKHASTSITKGSSRRTAKGAGSQERRYVNVAGGRRSDPRLEETRDEIRKMGFTCNIVPGPLLLASTGSTKQEPTLMPLATSSAGGAITGFLQDAHESIKKSGVIDEALDVAEGEVPKWTSHSLRRLANSVARRDMAKTDTSAAEIDIYFGWHEKILLKEMQRHYEQMSTRTRMSKSKITSLL